MRGGGMIPTAAVITRCIVKSNEYPAHSDRARCGSTGIIPTTPRLSLPLQHNIPRDPPAWTEWALGLAIEFNTHAARIAERNDEPILCLPLGSFAGTKQSLLGTPAVDLHNHPAQFLRFQFQDERSTRGGKFIQGWSRRLITCNRGARSRRDRLSRSGRSRRSRHGREGKRLTTG